MIAHHLNVVMKFLTSVTILLSLPALVASVYGMNVGLPFQDHPQAFTIVVAASLVVSFIVAMIFWKKDWI